MKYKFHPLSGSIELQQIKEKKEVPDYLELEDLNGIEVYKAVSGPFLDQLVVVQSSMVQKFEHDEQQFIIIDQRYVLGTLNPVIDIESD